MHNFKRPLKVLISLLLVIFLIKALDVFLYPCTMVRNNIHTLTSKPKDVLIMGTSHAMTNIDPDTLLKDTSLSGQNLAIGNEFPIDQYYMIKLAMEKQSPKTVLLEVSPGYYTLKKEVDNNYSLFYHEFPVSKTKLEYFMALMPECDLRTALFPFFEYPLKTELSLIDKTAYKKLTLDYGTQDLKSSTQSYNENGFVERYPVAQEDMQEGTHVEFDKEKINEDNLKYLRKMIMLCKQNNIRVIAITTPFSDTDLKMHAEEYKNAWDFFEDEMDSLDVPYYNFNTTYYDYADHDIECYVDYDNHMNKESAENFSEVLSDFLKEKGEI